MTSYNTIDKCPVNYKEVYFFIYNFAILKPKYFKKKKLNPPPPSFHQQNIQTLRLTINSKDNFKFSQLI